MTEWQPIETAPKDGTHILAYRRGYAWDTAVIWFDKEFQTWAMGPGMSFPNPTYWMKLSPPPMD